MPQSVDAVVIGAGVVGLACARRLAQAGLETIVVEREARFGQGISSRNSEVIHAGLYYPTGSLKAKLCVAGRKLLYEYVTERGVPHRRLGKLVVATGRRQVEALDALARRARANGCSEVEMLSGAEARRMEPALRCDQALSSPRTGIVDSHALMLSFLGDIQQAGGYLALEAEAARGEVVAAGMRLWISGDDETCLDARYVVNAAGLDAPGVARRIAGFPDRCVPRQGYAKGSYFVLSGVSPFGRLVYPMPEPGGLGVHLTLDMEGRARFGPDVEWVSCPEYAVDSAKREAFARAIREYWPDCDARRLQPGYAGVRPKLEPNAEGASDFLIQGAETHGISGLVNMFGIESPGLTASLAIADEVATRLALH